MIKAAGIHNYMTFGSALGWSLSICNPIRSVRPQGNNVGKKIEKIDKRIVYTLQVDPTAS
jgi:hypothetical protein